MSTFTIVKVGGSLFDHPGLAVALRKWLAMQPAGDYRLLAGGGPAADVVRRYHRTHGLSEEFSHWLAIRTMDINGALLRELAGDAAPVVDAFAFCNADEVRPGALEHTWRVTSDAIAARVAEVLGASELVMLKSIDLPEGITWHDAADAGLVDRAFGDVISRSNLAVRWVNLRSQ